MSDIYSIEYSSEAVNDLKDIYSYIAFNLSVPNTARKQTTRITKGIRTLNSMPARHPIVDFEPWNNMNVHKLYIDNFIIYYIIDNFSLTVSILRIMYKGRDVQNIVNNLID